MNYRAYFSLTVRLIIAVTLFVLGIMVGQYSDSFLPGAPQSYRDVTDLSQGYKFIDPLLFCADRDMEGQTAAFSQKLESTLAQKVNDLKQSGAVTDASVLYRDLSNGPRVSVNGDMQSSPASLLKVPLALSIHRRAEKEPGFLDKKVKMDISDQNGGQNFPGPRKAEQGKEYTIHELLDLSLIDSDNNATDLLIMQLSEDELRNSYEDLGIKVPIDAPGSYTINVGVYSSFFRILYNASYLSRDVSEHLLEDLAGSTFSQGIVSGVPEGTKVAHKFGEYTTEVGQTQLHDCGIVYRTERPYLLCVMTKGKDPQKLAGSIAAISKTVWDIGP